MRAKKTPAIADRCLAVVLICCYLLLVKPACPVISLKIFTDKEVKACVAVKQLKQLVYEKAKHSTAIVC